MLKKFPFASGMTGSSHLYRCSKKYVFSSDQVFFVVIRLSLNAIFDTFLHPKTIPDHPNKKKPPPEKIFGWRPLKSARDNVFNSFISEKCKPAKSKKWSWGPESDRRPTVYETVALPTELPQPVQVIQKPLLVRGAGSLPTLLLPVNGL